MKDSGKESRSGPEWAIPMVSPSALSGLFAGPGEMRALCRDFDWTASPLGPPASWPTSLRTLVTMILSTRHPMFLWWGAEFVQIFNDAYRQIFGEGGEHARALGARGSEFWSDIWHIIGPQIDQVMAGGESTWHEDQLVPIIRNGHRENVWWTYGFSPVLNDQGTVGGVLVVCMDTTARVLSDIEREWMHDATRSAEQRASRVLERMSDAHFVLDDQYRYVTVNQAMERAIGVSRSELVGRVIWDVFPGFVGSEFERQYREVATRRTEAHFTHSYIDDRVDVVAEVDVYPAEDEGIAVFWRDVSARASAEAVLRSREAETRTLADAIPTLAWTARPDGYIDWYNARWYEYTGTTPELMEGWGWQSVHDPLTLPHVLKRWRASITTGEPFEMTFPLRSAAGEFRSFLTRVVPVRDGEGSVARWFGTNTDVESESEARRQSEAARQHTARMQALTAALSSASTLEQVALAIVTHTPAILNADAAMVAEVKVDGATLRLLQASPMSEDVQSAWKDFPLDADVPVAEVARSGQPIFLESREQWIAAFPALEPFLRSTGHHANMVLPLLVDERAVGVIGAAYNSPRAFQEDERAMALAIAQQCAQALDRARLFESERFAREEAERANRSKGDFLAVISHELRTPLNAIAGHAELIELGIHGPVTPEQLSALARIQRSQQHLLGLINGVLSYSRIEAGVVEYNIADVSVEEVLTTCEVLVGPQARAKGLILAFQPCTSEQIVRADKEKFQQIVTNLVTNSIKFTASGGRIDIACTSDHLEARLSVTDTGKGIAPENLSRVFLPFVQVGNQVRSHEGVGLGLAISRDLARGMGGDLSVTSEIGAGSTFTLTLPGRRSIGEIGAAASS